MGVILVVHLIGTGRIKNYRAAREDTLSLLQRIEYSPDLFADSSDPNDSRPSGECCCCCENFNAERTIVRTPCEHYYHLECLGEWLKLAKTCPICRCDLDVATEEAALQKQSSDDEAFLLEETANSSLAEGSSAAGASSSQDA